MERRELRCPECRRRAATTPAVVSVINTSGRGIDNMTGEHLTLITGELPPGSVVRCGHSVTFLKEREMASLAHGASVVRQSWQTKGTRNETDIVATTRSTRAACVASNATADHAATILHRPGEGWQWLLRLLDAQIRVWGRTTMRVVLTASSGLHERARRGAFCWGQRHAASHDAA